MVDVLKKIALKAFYYWMTYEKWKIYEENEILLISKLYDHKSVCIVFFFQFEKYIISTQN